MGNSKKYHKKFLIYCDYIVNHPNYKGMPNKFNPNGKINWVVTGKSEIGRLRESWWMEGVNKNDDCFLKSDFARKNHPKELNGMKPCQTCGKEMSIHYVYPTKNLQKKLLDHSIQFENNESFENIFDRVKKSGRCHIWKDVFPDLYDYSLDHILMVCKKMFSPGVMSNAPDRFDGFHSYNKCCRSKEDTGRSKENLKSYSQDRRSYEYWTDGNYNLVNRLMSEFNKYKNNVICSVCGKLRKPSPDHIGPLSLGFSNSIYNIQSMCKPCNSAKNNRMTLSDFHKILKLEKTKGNMVSWHTQYLWNSLKTRVNNQSDLDKLGNILSHHLKTLLVVFNEVSKSENGEKSLIKKLNPQYSFYSYDFVNFDPSDLSNIEIIENELESKNKRKNSERYIRISFESIFEMDKKNNRKKSIIISSNVSNIISQIKKSNNYDEDLNLLVLTLNKEFCLRW